jgi:alpha-tubulin suppressor-like RCC1 family protein
MSGITTTNFIANDGSDIGIELIEKDYLRRIYPSLADQFITPELWVWGDLADADGTLEDHYKSTPVTTFAGGSNWKTIGQSSSMAISKGAIKTDGTLWVWGQNLYGELGTNTLTQSLTPVTTFAGGSDWKQLSNGYSINAAIKTDGSLWTWGLQSNSFLGAKGGLGVNDTINRSTPVTTFAGGNDWSQVSVGFEHIAAIKNDGSLWNWGNNKKTPITSVGGNSSWKIVHCPCAIGSILAIKNDGSLWNWGENTKGQLGTNDTTSRTDSPVTTFAGGNNWKQITSASTFQQFSVGECEIYATKNDGSLWTWGGANSALTPITTFVGGNDWRIIRDGFAIKTNGTLWKLNPYTPTLFDGSSNWKICSAKLGIKTIEDV